MSDDNGSADELKLQIVKLLKNQQKLSVLDFLHVLCNQLFLNENACSGDESGAKVLF